MYQPTSSNKYSPNLSREYSPQILYPPHPPRISEVRPIQINYSQITNLNNKNMSLGYQQVIVPSSRYQVPHYYLPPTYLVQPNQIIRPNTQNNFTLNFDTETANSLCDGKIDENVIFCVVCQSKYKEINQQQHIKKHKRKRKISPLKDHLTDKLDAYRKLQVKPKREYIIKPIVEPEESTIKYKPKIYNLTKEIYYEDVSFVEKQSRAIGCQENSFSFYNHNMTINNNSINYVPNRFIKTEKNPFINKKVVLHPFNLPFISTQARQSGENSKESNDEYISVAHEATSNKQQFSFENVPIVCEPINNTRELVHRLRSFSDPIEVKDQAHSFSMINGSITHLLKEESLNITEKGQILS